MDLITKTKEIIKKHNLAEKLTFNPFKIRRAKDIGFDDFPEFKGSYEKVVALQLKYDSRVPMGWYGIDLYEAPISWLNALEEFLVELEKDSPDFEIHQLKIKYGCFRGYMANLSENAEKAVDLLEEAMQDTNLLNHENTKTTNQRTRQRASIYYRKTHRRTALEKKQRTRTISRPHC